VQRKQAEYDNIVAERDWLADMLNEGESITFYDSNEGKYSFELRQCIYTLLTLNVTSQNVSKVIECVLKLVGRK